jgi:hypothetical protein
VGEGGNDRQKIRHLMGGMDKIFGVEKTYLEFWRGFDSTHLDFIFFRFFHCPRRRGVAYNVTTGMRRVIVLHRKRDTLGCCRTGPSCSLLSLARQLCPQPQSVMARLFPPSVVVPPPSIRGVLFLCHVACKGSEMFGVGGRLEETCG